MSDHKDQRRQPRGPHRNDHGAGERWTGRQRRRAGGVGIDIDNCNEHAWEMRDRSEGGGGVPLDGQFNNSSTRRPTRTMASSGRDGVDATTGRWGGGLQAADIRGDVGYGSRPTGAGWSCLTSAATTPDEERNNDGVGQVVGSYRLPPVKVGMKGGKWRSTAAMKKTQ